MNRLIALFVATAPLLSLAGCCEMPLIADITVSVTDVDGQPIAAEVEFEKEDELVACDEWDPGYYACFGASGETDVFVTAEGYESAFETAVVPWERCGHGSTSIDVTLEAIDAS